jgi:hypothetical protein
MVIALKAAALAGALMLGGGAAADTCNCPPPVIETVSCLSGVSSFAPATCTTGQTQFRSFPFEILTCRPGEFAISAGYRALLDQLPPSGVPVMVQMTPVVGPVGDHAHSYRFVWRPAGGGGVSLQQALGQFRVYITCEGE